MKVDLKGLGRKELEKLRADVDKALARVAETERKVALIAAEKAAQAHGYSLADLTGAASGKAAANGSAAPAVARKAASKSADGRSKVAPKFRNPENPEQTWSGRGRAPKWVEAYLAAGGSLDQITI